MMPWILLSNKLVKGDHILLKINQVTHSCSLGRRVKKTVNGNFLWFKLWIWWGVKGGISGLSNSEQHSFSISVQIAYLYKNLLVLEEESICSEFPFQVFWCYSSNLHWFLKVQSLLIRWDGKLKHLKKRLFTKILSV